MSTRLVIFDCDGVLVDSERLTNRVEARVLGELGWPLSPADVARRFLGRSSEAMLAEVAAEIGGAAARRFDEISTREIHAAFDRELTEVPGVSSLLDALDRAGMPTCVASSGSHAKMARTLGLTGLQARFEGRIFSASEVRHGKPAPDLFLHAARRMGADPAGCTVIEDSPYGVRAGVAAGMRVIGYGSGLVAPEVLAHAGAEVVLDLADVLGLLRGEVQSTVE